MLEATENRKLYKTKFRGAQGLVEIYGSRGVLSPQISLRFSHKVRTILLVVSLSFEIKRLLSVSIVYEYNIMIN